MTDVDEVRRLRLENERLQNSLNGINEKFVGNIIAIQSRANVVLDKFRAENEKLRAALRSLINAAEEITDDGMSHSERDWWFRELKAAFDALGDRK